MSVDAMLSTLQTEKLRHREGKLFPTVTPIGSGRYKVQGWACESPHSGDSHSDISQAKQRLSSRQRNLSGTHRDTGAL
jgi:hypothetical protein